MYFCKLKISPCVYTLVQINAIVNVHSKNMKFSPLIHHCAENVISNGLSPAHKTL